MAAAAADTASPAKKSSLVVQLGLLLALTVGAIGTGWMTGSYLTGQSGPAGSHGAPAHGDEAVEAGSQAMAQSLKVFLLEDITTNLAGPGDMWVRMAIALVFKDQPDPQLAELIHQDLLAYLRSVKAHQVEGASGFQHLKADLEERAILRSEGKVKQILIRTLLFE